LWLPTPVVTKTFLIIATGRGKYCLDFWGALFNGTIDTY
jgi:hypothetical protein